MDMVSCAAACLPPCPSGMVVRWRSMDGQPFTAGAFFRRDATSVSGMARVDVAKLAAVTLDVDAYSCDSPAAVARWGSTRAERKTAMRAASSEDVLRWMADTDMVATVITAVSATGAPPPNRVVFTGQGFALIYWLADDEGGPTGEWSAARIRRIIRRWSPGAWWRDDGAKDAGTRLFPLPGGRHRVSGKLVQVLSAVDDRQPLAPWLARLEATAPAGPSPRPRVAGSAVARAALPLPPGAALPPGGRGPCPACGGQTRLRHLDRGHYCFGCGAWFRPEANPMPRPGYSARLVPLDALGHAVLPSPGEMAPRLVLATGTGTGKTRAIAAAVAAHPFRVVAISPTIALAHAMGQRLGLRVVGATDRAPGPNESAVICFAGLQRIGVGALPDVTLFNTMLVIDEVESCLSQLLTMLKKGDGTAIYNKLVRMVGYAGRVILSDAHFGAAARRLLLDVDADRESRGDCRLVWDHIRTEPHRHLFRVIRPRFSESGRATESAGAIHEAVIADRVARGLRLAIYVPGRRRALAFAAVLSERFPSRTVRCVVRPRCEEDKPDLSADSLLVDVLVYNNAMSTGVSIDTDGWFDERHILLGSAAAVVDGPMIEQASHRVRRPKREEIWISGGTGNAPPAGDWRYNADDHLRRGLERVFSAEDVSNRVRGTRIQLAGDENCSAESLRMARMQAEVLAARYRHGWRWAAEWLSARHEWSDAGIGGLDSLGDAVAVEQERQEYAEAWSVAASAPLDPRAAKKYDDSGVLPPDALTADALSSARLDALYGEASKGATLHDRADLYLADRRGLYRQCQVFAAMEIVAAADPVAVAALRQWDARMIRQSTVTLARPVLPVAVAIAAALNAVVGLDDISPEVAGAALRRIGWLSTAAALPPSGEIDRPIAALGMLLARAGIRLTGRRVGPRGARRRAYRVDHASIEAMRLRAATARSSIMSVEPRERLETA